MSSGKISRRALLGGAVAAPLLPRRPGLDPGSGSPPSGQGTRWTPDQVRGDGAWEQAVDAFRAAEAEVRGFERATAGSSAEEEEIWLPVYEARLDAFGGAVRGVMLAGAPDFAAFVSKLELFFEHELEPDSVEVDVLSAIRADARRLAGGEALPGT